jgi:hypothetical protein
VLPYAGTLIPGSAMVLAIALAWRKFNHGLASFLIYSGIVQLYLLPFISIASAIEAGRLNLFNSTTGYGMFSLFFGTVGIWLMINDSQGKADAVSKNIGEYQ